MSGRRLRRPLGRGWPKSRRRAGARTMSSMRGGARGERRTRSQRPVTQYTYSPAGPAHPDRPSGLRTRATHEKGVTREKLHVLGSEPPLGSLYTDGSAGELGRLASHDVGRSGWFQQLRPASTHADHLRPVGTGNAGGPAAGRQRQQRALGGERNDERLPGPDDARAADPARRDGALHERRVPPRSRGPRDPEAIDTTSDPAAGTRIYALVEYTYGASGLVTVEEGSATASTVAAPWTGSGASTERRFAHDAFGHVVQEATRLSDEQLEDRPSQFRRSPPPADRRSPMPPPLAGQAPPASDDDLNGDRVVHQFWYNETTGLLDWEQVRGEGSGNRSPRRSTGTTTATSGCGTSEPAASPATSAGCRLRQRGLAASDAADVRRGGSRDAAQGARHAGAPSRRSCPGTRPSTTREAGPTRAGRGGARLARRSRAAARMARSARCWRAGWATMCAIARSLPPHLG